MRPRKYDKDESLDCAISVFHRFGYRGATLNALLRATDLGRGSLYYAFRGKHQLFLAALDRYRRTVVKPHLDRLEVGLSPKRNILELFERVTSHEDNGGVHLGSLITNAAIELAPHDARVRTVVAEHFADIESALLRAVERAQELGEVSPRNDAIKIARGLLGVLQGLLVLARSGAREYSGRQTAEVVLDEGFPELCPENFLG